MEQYLNKIFIIALFSVAKNLKKTGDKMNAYGQRNVE